MNSVELSSALVNLQGIGAGRERDFLSNPTVILPKNYATLTYVEEYIIVLTKMGNIAFFGVSTMSTKALTVIAVRYQGLIA